MPGDVYPGGTYPGEVPASGEEPPLPTITNPGEQTTKQNESVSLELHGEHVSTFEATNLPPGLKVTANVISGKPTELGNFEVTVTVRNSAGKAEATFHWIIEQAGALVKRIWAGPFFGLYRGQRIVQGAPVEIPAQEAVSTWFR